MDLDQTSRVKVLLIEDNLEIAKLRAYLLEDLGCAVTTALTADEAAKTLAATDVLDLVLADINLGGGPRDQTGLDLVRLSRQRRPDTPVVAYSAFFEESELPIAQYPEVTQWLVKGSLGLSDLEQSLKGAVQLGRQARAARGE